MSHSRGDTTLRQVSVQAAIAQAPKTGSRPPVVRGCGYALRQCARFGIAETRNAIWRLGNEGRAEPPAAFTAAAADLRAGSGGCLVRTRSAAGRAAVLRGQGQGRGRAVLRHAR